MTKPRYALVKGGAGFEDECAALIDEGYIPVGSVVTDAHQYAYTQAFYRPGLIPTLEPEEPELRLLVVEIKKGEFADDNQRMITFDHSYYECQTMMDAAEAMFHHIFGPKFGVIDAYEDLQPLCYLARQHGWELKSRPLNME